MSPCAGGLVDPGLRPCHSRGPTAGAAGLHVRRGRRAGEADGLARPLGRAHRRDVHRARTPGLHGRGDGHLAGARGHAVGERRVDRGLRRRAAHEPHPGRRADVPGRDLLTSAADAAPSTTVRIVSPAAARLFYTPAVVWPPRQARTPPYDPTDVTAGRRAMTFGILPPPTGRLHGRRHDQRTDVRHPVGRGGGAPTAPGPAGTRSALRGVRWLRLDGRRPTPIMKTGPIMLTRGSVSSAGSGGEVLAVGSRGRRQQPGLSTRPRPGRHVASLNRRGLVPTAGPTSRIRATSAAGQPARARPSRPPPGTPATGRAQGGARARPRR